MENELFEVEALTLEMEDGTEQEFAIVDTFDFEGNDYILLGEIDENDEIGEPSVYGYVKDGEEYEINEIEDDELYKKIVDAYNEMEVE